MSNKQLIEFKLKDGSSAIFETQSDDNEMRRLNNDNEPETADESFESVVARIKPVAEIVLDALKELNTPNEIGIEFGVKLGTKAGVIFASANAETNFKVSLKWSNSK